MIISAAIHLHTTLSHDGALTLQELILLLKPHGYQALFITEHSQDVNKGSMDQLMKEAAELSNEKLLIVPGIEFTCSSNIHILGLGVTSVIEQCDPVIAIEHIHSHNGLAVLAHPWIREYPLEPSWIAKLDGCEIWNISGDGKCAPQTASIKMFSKLSGWNDHLLAFGNLDLHSRKGFYPVFTDIETDELTPDSLINAMSSGSFRTRSRFYSCSSYGHTNPIKKFLALWFRKSLNIVRQIRDINN